MNAHTTMAGRDAQGHPMTDGPAAPPTKAEPATGGFTCRGAVVIWVDPGDGGREVEINDVSSLPDGPLMTISRIAGWWYLELPSLTARMLDELAARGDR